MTRRQRLRKTLRSPARQRRRARNREHRRDRRVMIEAWKLACRDERIIPPSWAWDYVYGSAVLQPKSLTLLTGIS